MHRNIIKFANPQDTQTIILIIIIIRLYNILIREYLNPLPPQLFWRIAHFYLLTFYKYKLLDPICNERRPSKCIIIYHMIIAMIII